MTIAPTSISSTTDQWSRGDDGGTGWVDGWIDGRYLSPAHSVFVLTLRTWTNKDDDDQWEDGTKGKLKGNTCHRTTDEIYESTSREALVYLPYTPHLHRIHPGAIKRYFVNYVDASRCVFLSFFLHFVVVAHSQLCVHIATNATTGIIKWYILRSRSLLRRITPCTYVSRCSCQARQIITPEAFVDLYS